MSEKSEQQQNPITLEALAQSTAQTFKIHSDMMMSIDTRLDRMAERQDRTDERLVRIAAIVENTATTVTELASTVQVFAGAVSKQEARVDTLEGKR